MTLENRFWSHVERGPDCWEWTARRDKDDYGQFAISKGKSAVAHRVAYSLSVGDIPDGMFVCHTCDNPPCCNPEHLWIGTNQDNMDDMVRKNRANAKNYNHGDRGMYVTHKCRCDKCRDVNNKYARELRRRNRCQ